MSDKELNEIYNNIQFQIICEQNSGYRNDYSKSLQQKMNLYNYIIDLKQALNKIRDYFDTSRFSSQFENNINEENVKLDILQIIDEVGGNEE